MKIHPRRGEGKRKAKTVNCGFKTGFRNRLGGRRKKGEMIKGPHR